MIGGSIPGRTKVVSVAVFERVEALDFAAAHWMSGLLVAFSFTVLFVVYALNRNTRTSP
jgi:molybdate transport system permease protein